MSRPVIAILASGEGTTAEAFIRASAEGHIEPTVGLVIASNAKAGILRRVASLNKEYGLSIAAVHLGKATHPPRPGEDVRPGEQTADEEAALLEILQAGNLDAVVLMGYAKKVGPQLVRTYGWRADYQSPHQAMMLNTHPGLLPETKGMFGIHVQEHVLDNNLTHGGQTLHVVAEDYDEGPVVAEHRVEVVANDTPDELFNRVRSIEKQQVPLDVAQFITERKRRKI
jgi:phosphoribosylglycinamide formyltransferase 1